MTQPADTGSDGSPTDITVTRFATSVGTATRAVPTCQNLGPL